MKPNFFNKKFWIAVGTVLVIGAILCYYLFVVVVRKEKELAQKGYRVLEQIDKNLNNKIENLNKNAEFIFKAIHKLTKDDTALLTLKENWLDSKLVAKKTGIDHSYQDYYNLMDKVYEEAESFVSYPYALDRDWNSFYNPDSSNYYFQFRNDTTIELSLQSSYDNIIKGVFIPGEFFDDLVILKECNETKEQINPGVRVLKKNNDHTKVIYQTFKNKIDIRHLDSLLNYSTGIYSGGIIETSVADSEYKVFVHRLLIQNNGNGNGNKIEEWTLIGFMKTSAYREKSREVNSVLLFSVLLLFVLIILALPILKLAIMSGVERLQITNVFAIGLSLTIGISIVTLILISTGNYLRGYYENSLLDENDKETKITLLANTIHQHFTSEVQAIVDQLYMLREKYDSLDSLAKKDPYITNRKPFKLVSTDSPLFSLRKDFNQIIWINNKGELDLTLAKKTVSRVFDQLVLKDRKYFQKIKAKDYWRLNKKEFYVESIISWYDGTLEAVVSIPAKACKNSTTFINDDKVLILAATLHSVSDPVLPSGYSFCIVDENGEVQFHSDKAKNLRENLLDETERNNNLVTCLKLRVAKAFTGLYQGKDHCFSIKPVNGTGLFVVAMHDMDYFQIPLEMATRLTGLLILAMFGLFGIHNLILYGTTFKASKLKIRRFFLSWLSPQTSEQFRLRYSILTIINVLFIILFLLLPPLLPCRLKLIFLLVPVDFLYLSYITITLWDHEKSSSQNASTIAQHKFTWLSFLLLALFILFISTVSDDLSSGAIGFIIVSIAIPLLILVSCYCIGIILEKNKSVRNFFSDATHSMTYYYFFLISWLIVSGVLPVINFYKLGTHEESLAWLKFNQLETCKKLNAFQGVICESGIQNICDIKTAPEKQIEKSVYGNYAYATGDYRKSEALKISPQNQSHFDNVLSEVRMAAFDLPENLQYGSYSSSTDSTWSATTKICQSLFTFNESSVVTTTYQCTSLATVLPDKLKNSNLSLFLVLIILLTIAFFTWLLYALIRYICKHIYGIEIFSSRKSGSVPTISLKEQINVSPKLFLVGLPYSGKMKCLNELKENWGDDQYIEINLISSLEGVDEFISNRGTVKNVILTHFEYGMNNHVINQKKLNILEKLLGDPETKIVVSSSVQHVAILDFYEIMIDRALSKDKSDDAYSEIKEYRLAFRQWQNILNGFVTVYQSLVIEPVKLSGQYNNEIISETIQEELKHGVFLRTLEPLLFKYYNGLLQAQEDKFRNPDEEDIILRIEMLADAYYQAIWNSFTKNEKFLLYDLAKDRFINTKNIKEIKILMEKGIIHMTTSIQLMNHSFNNFILSVVREDEELAMEQEMAQKGSWKSAQLVLSLSLLGLAIFFTLAQQNLLQNFNAMLTAVGAALALVARFGGLFGGGSKQKDV